MAYSVSARPFTIHCLVACCRIVDTQPLTEQRQIAQVFGGKVITRMTQHLHLGGDAGDGKPSDPALSGKVFVREDEILVRPGWDPIAPLVETHGVRVDLSPLRIL